MVAPADTVTGLVEPLIWIEGRGGGGGAAIPISTVKVAEPLNMVSDPVARIRTEYCPGVAGALHALTRSLPAIAKYPIDPFVSI